MIAFPKRLLILTQLFIILFSILTVFPAQKASAIAGGDMNFPPNFEETLSNSIKVKFIDPYHIEVSGAPGVRLFDNDTWPNDITYASILNTIYTIGEGCTWSQSYTLEFNDGERDRTIQIDAIIKKGKYEGDSTFSNGVGAIGTAIKWSSYIATFGATALAEKAVDSAFSNDGENKCDLPSPAATDQSLIDWFPTGEFSQHNLTIRVNEGGEDGDSVYMFEKDDDGSAMGWFERDGGAVFGNDFRGLRLADYFRDNKAARDGLRLGYAFVDKDLKKIVATYDASKEFLLCEGKQYFQEGACNSGSIIQNVASPYNYWDSMTDAEIIESLTGTGMYDAVIKSGNDEERRIQIAQLDSELSKAIRDGLIDPIAGEEGILEDSCEDNDGEFVFFQCAIIRAASDAINELDARIRAALEVKPEYYNNPLLRDSWSNFRDIAYLLLIPALLIIVISTALGYSFVDAYTVKRALPKLIIAIIFIALSFDICTALIELTTTVGKGVGGLIATPFGGSDALTLTNIFRPDRISGVALGGGVIGGIALAAVGGVTLGILASYLLVGAISITIIFALLTMREMIILFLIIISPLGVIKWKLWWGTFSKLLLLYPLIIALLVTGRAFAYLMAETNPDGIEGVFLTFAKLVAYIGPFFFIPAAFKFAGGAFANLAGMANDRSTGFFDRQRKWRGERKKERKEQIANGGFFRKSGRIGSSDFGKKLNNMASSPYDLKSAVKRDGALSLLSRDNLREGIENSRDRTRIHEQGAAAKDEVLATKGLNDNFLHMLEMLMKGAPKQEIIDYLEDNGLSRDQAKMYIRQGNNMYDQYGHGLAKIISDGKASSKTSHTANFAEHLRNIVELSHGNEQMMMELLGSGIGAFNQAGRLEMSGGSYGEKAAMLKALANVGADGMYNGELDDDGNAIIRYTNELTGKEDTLDLSNSHGKDATQTVADLVNKRQMSKARDSIGTWDWSRIHPTSVKNVMSDIQSGVEASSARLEAFAGRDEDALNPEELKEKKAAERALGQQIGQLQSLRANAMQSGNDEVQRIVADALDGGTPIKVTLGDVTVTSVSELIQAAQGPVSRRVAITDTDGKITGEKLVTDMPSASITAGIAEGYQSVSKMPGGMTPEQAEQLRQQNAPKS